MGVDIVVDLVLIMAKHGGDGRYPLPCDTERHELGVAGISVQPLFFVKY